MNARKKTKVLYFTQDGLLTDAQWDELNSIPGAQHRNASLVEADDALEPCDAVAGHGIPQAYRDAYPLVDDADDGDDDAADLDDTAPADMTVPQLRATLKAAGVEFEATAKKAELVQLLETHQGA